MKGTAAVINTERGTVRFFFVPFRSFVKMKKLFSTWCFTRCLFLSCVFASSGEKS